MNGYKYKILTVSCLLLLAVSIWMHVHTQKYPVRIIHSYQDALSELYKADQRTLVLFDVDDTLISSPDVLARTFNFSLWFKLCLIIKHPQLIKHKTWELVMSEMWQ